MSKRNPKDIAGGKKVPMHLLPAVGKIAGAMACRQGAIDYGPYNWRQTPIELMGYLGAIERHLDTVKDGQDVDRRSLVKHLGGVIATASIILDAEVCGTLIDDRVLPKGGKCPAYEAQKEAMQTIDEIASGVLDGHQGRLARMGLKHADTPVQAVPMRRVPRIETAIAPLEQPIVLPEDFGEAAS